MQDPYFSRPEVSNSDLSALKKLLYPSDQTFDPTQAYAFGTLIDCMITEPHKVDYFKLTVQGEDYKYSADDFDLSKRMKASFMKDDFAKIIVENASFQHISIKHGFEIEHNNLQFTLDVRCKFDFFFKGWKMGGDIKSTTAETQSQFESACEHFDYFRSRAFYMDIEGTNKDMLIGISKKNNKVFKLPINRGDKYHQKGKEQYQELAFKYWMLFDGLKLTA